MGFEKHRDSPSSVTRRPWAPETPLVSVHSFVKWRGRARAQRYTILALVLSVSPKLSVSVRDGQSTCPTDW